MNINKDNLDEEIINECLFDSDNFQKILDLQPVVTPINTTEEYVDQNLSADLINLPNITVALENKTKISKRNITNISKFKKKDNLKKIHIRKVFHILMTFFITLPVWILIIGRIIFPNFSFIIHVPSESMQPTLNVNENFFVVPVKPTSSNMSYGIYGFYSEEKDINMVKRLIGLPNDHIEFKDGILYRNGNLVEESYVLYEDNFNCIFDVPSGKYLFLGDNRSNSLDARYWQNPYIDAKDIRCKIIARISPYYKFKLIN